MKKVIIWDFDGVIVNSNSIREKGFREVFKSYHINDVNKLLKYHNKNGGLSRYHKIEYFYKEILSKEISALQIDAYANSFSDIMLKEMTNPIILIEETLNFLKNNYKKVDFYIASGSDQKELRILASSLKIDIYFKEIFGSPIDKNTLVKNIIDKVKIKEDKICLIGDAINDYTAANINNISFYGYNNIELKKNVDSQYYIESFKNVKINEL